MILLLIVLFIHIFYTIFSTIYLGYIDKSYSDTFYKLKGKKNWHRIFFWFWISGITIPAIYYFRDVSWICSAGALMTLGVLFSSYTVQLKERTKLHVFSALSGILGILLGFIVKLSNWNDFNIFNYSVFLLLILSIIILPIHIKIPMSKLFKKVKDINWKMKQGIRNHTYWIESVYITIPVITLIINKLIR